MVQWIELDPSKVAISVQFGVWVPLYADVAQLVSAIGSYPIGFGGSSPLIGTSTSFFSSSEERECLFSSKGTDVEHLRSDVNSQRARELCPICAEVNAPKRKL